MSRPARSARIAYAVVAAVAAFAVLWQLVLVVQGHGVLDESVRDDVTTRLVRFISYFTGLSNLLVVAVSAALVARPERDGPAWRVLQLATLVGIAVTGVVHWFLLRPVLDLTGASYAVDKLLHVVVPLLFVAAWVWVGPRGRAGRAQVLPTLGWPLAWGAYTIAHGLVSDWWPYPFIDVDALGWGRVGVNLLGVAVLFAGLGALAAVVDGRLGRRRPGVDG